MLPQPNVLLDIASAVAIARKAVGAANAIASDVAVATLVPEPHFVIASAVANDKRLVGAAIFIASQKCYTGATIWS